MAAPTVSLGPDATLSCEAVERAARPPAPAATLTSAAETALRRSRDTLDEVRERGDDIYGLTTGFGALLDHPAAENQSAQSEQLLAHLSTGSGDWAAPDVVRAMVLSRLQSMAQGHSGIRPTTVESLLRLWADAPPPAVPEVGSLGASGDLTPLAHAARAYTGHGRMLDEDGAPVAARTALQDAGLAPVSLDARDALAFVNGTAFMTGTAALALARGRRLLERTEALTGWAYRLLGCSMEALSPRLHAPRGHAGQKESAAAIRAEATRTEPTEPSDRPLQEVYSLRCAPQILGAARDQFRYARTQIEAELNGANDNPVVDPETPAVLHGGNFQGQQVAFAADALNEALTQIGVLAERQIDVLLSPDQNGGAPPLLAWTPGPTSGLAGAQLTATALVAELRQNAQMTATSSIPTNNDNQDVVSMGALAARTAYEQTERLASILAVLGLSLAQLTHLRDAGRADGPSPPPPDWMPAVDPIVEDRPLKAEIDDLARRWCTPDPS